MKQTINQRQTNYRCLKRYIIVCLLAFIEISVNAANFMTGTEAEFDAAYASSTANDVINLTSNIVVTSEKILSKSITINGNGFTISVPIPGLDDMGRFNTDASTFRVFTISTGYNVICNNLTIKGGLIASSGGAIYVVGTLHLNNCVVSNSKSKNGGGGIYNSAVVFLNNSLISRNAASYGGGFLNFGKMYVENSTYSENRSIFSGGGAGENHNYLYINNSAISNNQSTEIGGGINNYGGTTYIVNSSVTGNVAYGSSSGGGIGNNSGFVYAVNTLFAYNYRRTGGNVTNPTSYQLDDIIAYSNQNNVYLYNCIYHAALPSNTNDVIGNIHYTGLADGTDNTIFTGGSSSKIIDGTGVEIGIATVFRPYLAKDNGLMVPALKPVSFALMPANSGTQTRFANNNNVSPVVSYYNTTSASWVDLTGVSSVGQLVNTDQVGTTRSNAPAIGAIESVTDNLYMVKVNASTYGTVNGGTLYGDIYVSGSSVALTAIPISGYHFVRWDYVLGGSGIASTSNHYIFTVTSDVTLSPVFDVNTASSYIITYIGNNNTSGDAPTTETYSTSTTIAGSGTLANMGYIFNSWNTNANGSGIGYAVGSTYSLGTNLILYAIWTQNSTGPTITTDAATNITANAATLNGIINANNASTTVTFEYGPTTSYGNTATATQSPVTGTLPTTVSYELSGLTPNTTYHYRINGINSDGTTNSTDFTFTTLSAIPIVTTQVVSSIGSSTATGNGNITELGSPAPTAYGVCWNTAGAPVITDHVTDHGAASAIGAFTAAINGLTANTTYHVRAYATNSLGTSYGDEVTFKTTEIAPNISYATPQSYTVGTPIAALTPTNTGGAAVAIASPQVTTFAGSGSAGSADGMGTAASFNFPAYLAADAAGNFYVSDLLNNMIRRITPAGDVSTLADASTGFNQPAGIAVDPTGNVYVVDNQNNRIRKITSAGVVSTLAGSDSGERGNADGVGTAARFKNPAGLVLDAAGNLYVADMGNNLIRKITPSGEVSTFAGSGARGSASGNGSLASFDEPVSIAIDAAGNLYITDSGNNLIRKINLAGDVITLAGSGNEGADNGAGTAASFNQPFGITVDASGNVYVADTYNNLIRKINPAGDVTTFAGNGNEGADNGAGETASFFMSYGVTVDASGNLYVADLGNNLIRKITQSAYTISPALPAGLSLNGATGTITGTPTATSAATTYTVTTANSGGSSTATISITVKNTQTITFDALATKTYGDATFNLTATSDAPLTVSYSSDNTAVATVSGSTVTIVGAGTANITASQVGNGTYVAATNIIQQLTVNKKALAVTATADTRSYDGTTVSKEIPAVEPLAAGDEINVAPTQAFDNASVGATHVLTASGLTIKKGSTDVTGNYDISYATTAGTIYKLRIRVRAVTDTKTYDGTTASTVTPTIETVIMRTTIFKAATDSKTYDGTTVSKATSIVEPLGLGDEINVAPIQAFDNATVGTTHVLTASGLTIKNGSTDVMGNYDISYATATGTINKKAVTVTAAADTKSYDGTTVSKVTPAVEPLAAGDEINVAPTQAFDNATVGTTHVLTASGLTIKKGNTDATGNYDISYVPANGSITVISLTMTAPTVTLSKVYDGNKVATITTIGTLSGMLASDAGNVTVTAVASYDNATVGTNKTVTVVYTLGGSAAGNYSAPSDFIVTGAEISSGIITLEPLSNPTPGSANTGLVLSYSVVTGGPTQYQITFEAAALAVGIQNVSYTVLGPTNSDGTITITVPKGTKPGKYKGTLQMRNDSGVESPVYAFVMTVNIPTEYIAVKYNRVLVLDNSTRMFSAYQWYKDGVAIEGATKQFYRDPKGLVGTYMVQATTTDGEVLYSYPKVLNIPLSLKVTAYPTMVKANQACTVEITDEAMELDLTGAELSVYSIQGIRVYHSTKVESLNTIKLPIMDGVYSGRVTTADGQSFLFKVIVAN